MKKIILLLIIISSFLQIGYIFAVDVDYEPVDVSTSDIMVGKQQDNLFNIGGKDKVDLTLGVDPDEVTFRDNFLRVAQKYILGIVGMVAITMFIYIGMQLATAEGKQEQFTKAMKALIYLAVGLAIIPLAYIAVKIVTGFSF